jgi:hypothetical protein
MNKEYDKIFQDEVVLILYEYYYHPINMSETKIKRVVIETEKRFVTYLVKHNIVSSLKSVRGGGKWGLQLEKNGYEVFEKYNGWDDYKKKVIDPKSKVEKAKELSVKYWWLPILISVLSLVVAIIALVRS